MGLGIWVVCAVFGLSVQVLWRSWDANSEDM